MANQTVLVDNNTRNNSHIAQVRKAMASREEDAIKIMRQLDVENVLVIFGGLTEYASDHQVLVDGAYRREHGSADQGARLLHTQWQVSN